MTSRSQLSLLGLTLITLTIALAANARPSDAAQTSDSVAHLIQQLSDPDVQHRRDAARELGNMNPTPPEAIAALLDLSEKQQEDQRVEELVETALCNSGTAAIPIASKLAQSDDQLASKRGIGWLGCLARTNKQVWPMLIDLYKKDPKSGAMTYLSQAGAAAVPAIDDALKGDDPVLRRGAVTTISNMIAYVRNFSADWVVQNHIARISPKDLAPLQPQLVNLLQDADPDVRAQAAIALNFNDPHDLRPLQILIGLVAQSDDKYRDSAIYGLQTMGSLAQPAVPALEHVVEADPDTHRSTRAGSALVQIDKHAACDTLQRLIEHDPEEADFLLGPLVEIDPPCSRAIPILINSVRGVDTPLTPAISVLSKIGSPAVPALAREMKSANIYTRQNAASALEGMKPLPPEAEPILLNALNDTNSEVRGSAISALRELGGDAQKAADAAWNRDENAKESSTKPDTRVYSRREITARIPPDGDNMYSLTLRYMFPVKIGTSSKAQIFVTLHQGKARSDRLVIWRKVGDDRFQQLRLLLSDEENIGLDDHFKTPFTFNSKYERADSEGVAQREGLSLDIPIEGWRHSADYVFSVDGDRIAEVQVPEPCGSPGGGCDFHGGDLGFGENIYNRDDATCCPTGGSIGGTFKIVEDATKSPSVWRMVVASSKRTPPDNKPK